MKDDPIQELMQKMGKTLEPTEQPTPAPPPMAQQGGGGRSGSSSLAAMLDQEITIRGTARDAHQGAIVLTDDDRPVYIEGLIEWDSETHGKRVEVKGVLRKKKLAPDPTIRPDGAISHGSYGLDWVLEEANWTIVS